MDQERKLAVPHTILIVDNNQGEGDRSDQQPITIMSSPRSVLSLSSNESFTKKSMSQTSTLLRIDEDTVMISIDDNDESVNCKVFSHSQFVERFRVLANNKSFATYRNQFLDMTDLCVILVDHIHQNVLKKDDGSTVAKSITSSTIEGNNNNEDESRKGEIELTDEEVLVPISTLHRLEEERLKVASHSMKKAKKFLREQKLAREFGPSYAKKQEAAIVVQCFWRLIRAKEERKRRHTHQLQDIKKELASYRKLMQQQSLLLQEKETETLILQQKVDYLQVTNQKLSILAETLTVCRDNDTRITDETADDTYSSIVRPVSPITLRLKNYWRSYSCWNRYRYND